MNYKIIRYVASIILFIGTFKMPYGYYRFVRITTFITAGVFLYLSYKQKNELWLTIFGVLLILFNPIYPISFDKTTWAIIDVLSAGFILLSVKYVK